MIGLYVNERKPSYMNKKVYSISEIKNMVEPLAREYGVESLFLFGSYAKGIADENSDVDFRIDKGDVRGIRFAGLYTDLEEVLGKNVDLVTTASLDESFKKSIAGEEILLYAK